ncbi:MAG: hypothetical protein ACOCUL_01015 [Bacteroidota bacterium]
MIFNKNSFFQNDQKYPGDNFLRYQNLAPLLKFFETLEMEKTLPADNLANPLDGSDHPDVSVIGKTMFHIKNSIMRYFWLILTLIYTPTFSQNSDSFKFKEGIYLDFSQVKNDNPIPVASIITSREFGSRIFEDELLSKDKVEYFDAFGVKQGYETSKIWGYSKNGNLYIKIESSFNKITITGSICHFVANITKQVETGYNPMIASNYPYNYQSNVPTQFTSEIKQFIMDFSTGQIYDYNVENLKIILMKDEKLYDEYNSLKRKEKKKLKFLYIRKFNERNPLDIKTDITNP